jgi:hypothetical protein
MKQRREKSPKKHREGGARTKKNRNNRVKCILYSGQNGWGLGLYKKGDAACVFEDVSIPIAFNSRTAFLLLPSTPSCADFAEDSRVFDVHESLLALTLFLGGTSPALWHNMHRPLWRSLQITIASLGFMSPPTQGEQAQEYMLFLSQ